MEKKKDVSVGLPRTQIVVQGLIEKNEVQLELLNAATITFAAKCRSERSELQAEIIARDPTRFHDFSKIVLYTAKAPGARQLYWGTMEPPMGARTQGWLRKINNKGIEYSFDEICADAHRSERALIRRHEAAARKLRQDRQRKIQTRLELKKELRRLRSATIAV